MASLFVFVYYQLYNEEGNLGIRAEKAAEHNQQALLHRSVSGFSVWAVILR